MRNPSASRAQPRRLTPAGAEALVRWYLNESEGEACGLRAAAWNHTEEVTASAEVPRGRRGDRGSADTSTSGDTLRLALASPGRAAPSTSERVHVGAQTRAYHEVDVYPERPGQAYNDERRGRLLHSSRAVTLL